LSRGRAGRCSVAVHSVKVPGVRESVGGTACCPAAPGIGARGLGQACPKLLRGLPFTLTFIDRHIDICLRSTKPRATGLSIRWGLEFSYMAHISSHATRAPLARAPLPPGLPGHRAAAPTTLLAHWVSRPPAPSRVVLPARVRSSQPDADGPAPAPAPPPPPRSPTSSNGAPAWAGARPWIRPWPRRCRQRAPAGRRVRRPPS
jgi:hypothetical protein